MQTTNNTELRMKVKLKNTTSKIQYIAEINHEESQKTKVLCFTLVEDTQTQPRYINKVKWDMIQEIK